MKSYLIPLSILALMSIWSCKQNATQQSVDLLFQENTDTWLTLGNAAWSFDNGALIGSLDTGGGFVITKAVYQDFTLSLEFMPDSTINSGVFIRCEGEELNPFNCHELNIWDLHPNQDFRTGAIVAKTTPSANVHTINQWNTYKVECQDAQVKVYINDTLTANYTDTTRLQGYIGLQAAGSGEVRFRNVMVTF